MLTYLITALVAFLALSYYAKVNWAWVTASSILLFGWIYPDRAALSLVQMITLWGFGLLLIITQICPIRHRLISRLALKKVGNILPKISETERIALEAGSVWFDGELSSGNPNWDKMLSFKCKALTKAEKDFMNGPVETLCSMLDDWQIKQAGDLPKKVWDYLKKEKFFGMIIPTKYGGLGFSALLHSQVITKIASRSVSAAVTVMVPNSLGPAELLMRYGTEKQRKDMLNNLATGKDIPCFALTETAAGSDAASISSNGVICEGTYKGKKTIGIKLNWSKRYITLAPIASIIGLAFQLSDPNKLLSSKTDYGITCALIPRDTKGINIGKHHDPLGVIFHNGPIVGKNVFIPIDYVIGGKNGLGKGWQMLMECLSVGRSISLPALSIGASQLSLAHTTAYGKVREQFNVSIGEFEGIQERIADIVAYSYLMNGSRHLTCGAVDDGEHPSVISAMVKHYSTEWMRISLNHAMDIAAGSAICRGPRNILALPYASIPIGITVEGANILTRSLVIYGQGAIRCHPYVLDEIHAVYENHVGKFDKAFFGHIGFMIRNMVTAFTFAFTGGKTNSKIKTREMRRYLRQLTRYSTAYALISDLLMLTLGGGLKRREMITGRMADAFSYMYFALGAIKSYKDNGMDPDERIIAQWSLDFAIREIRIALYSVLKNMPNRVAGSIGRLLIFPWGMSFKTRNDKMAHQVAHSVMHNLDLRSHLTANIFIPNEKTKGFGQLTHAFTLATQTQTIKNKIKDAQRNKKLPRGKIVHLVNDAVKEKIITQKEATALNHYYKIQDDLLQVDAFP